ANGTARLWDAATGAPAGPPLAHAAAVRSVHFSPDSARLATVAMDRSLRLWSAADGRALGGPLPTPGVTAWVEFGADGRRLLLAGSHGVQVWELASGPPQAEEMVAGSAVRMARLHPDGRSWAAVHVPESGHARLEFRRGGAAAPAFTVPLLGTEDTLEFSPDGGRLLASLPGARAQVFTLPDGRPGGPPLQHNGGVTVAKWSPDGRRLLTAARDRTARVWDAASGRAVGEPLAHADDVWTAQWSPDGARVLTGTAEGFWRLWDAATGLPLGEPLGPHPCPANPHLPPSTTARFAPDGARLVLPAADGAAVILGCPAVTTPIPGWLPGLAEGVAGTRVTEAGALEPVDPAELLALRDRADALPGDAFWRDWARWFFADRETRALAPGAALTVGDYVARRRLEPGAAPLLGARRLRPDDAALLRALADALEAETNAPLAALQARWLRRPPETAGAARP
ncbi:MAG: WD40 repeat domain-containing protein, partial [Limisphaerales bacterium]